MPRITGEAAWREVRVDSTLGLLRDGLKQKRRESHHRERDGARHSEKPNKGYFGFHRFLGAGFTFFFSSPQRSVCSKKGALQGQIAEGCMA